MDSRDTNTNQMNFTKPNGENNGNQEPQAFMYQQHQQSPQKSQQFYNQQNGLSNPINNLKNFSQQSATIPSQMNHQQRLLSDDMHQLYDNTGVQIDQQVPSHNHSSIVSSLPSYSSLVHDQAGANKNIESSIPVTRGPTISSSVSESETSQVLSPDDFASLVKRRLRSHNKQLINSLDSNVPFIDLTEDDIINPGVNMDARNENDANSSLHRNNNDNSIYDTNILPTLHNQEQILMPEPASFSKESISKKEVETQVMSQTEQQKMAKLTASKPTELYQVEMKSDEFKKSGGNLTESRPVKEYRIGSEAMKEVATTMSNEVNSNKRFLGAISDSHDKSYGEGTHLSKKAKVNDPANVLEKMGKKEINDSSSDKLPFTTINIDKTINPAAEMGTNLQPISHKQRADLAVTPKQFFDSNANSKDQPDTETGTESKGEIEKVIDTHTPSIQNTNLKAENTSSPSITTITTPPPLVPIEKPENVIPTEKCAHDRQVNILQDDNSVARLPEISKPNKETMLEDDKLINSPWRSLDDFRHISTDEQFEALTNVLYRKMCQSLTGEHELKLLILSVINSCCLANDLPKLMTRLCMILMAFGRSSYGRKPDWRFVALKSIQDMRLMFQKSNNNVIDFQSDYLKKNKMFMRVSNWLRFDMSRKSYPDILKSLQFLKSVGLDRESLEYYKILPVLKKIMTFEDQKELITVSNEILLLSGGKKKQKLPSKVPNDQKTTTVNSSNSMTNNSSKLISSNIRDNESHATKSTTSKAKGKPVEISKGQPQPSQSSSMFSKFLPNKRAEKKDDATNKSGSLSTRIDTPSSNKPSTKSKIPESSKLSPPSASFSRFLPTKQQEKKVDITSSNSANKDPTSKKDVGKSSAESVKPAPAPSFSRFLPGKDEDKSASDLSSNANNSSIVEVEEDPTVDPKNGLKSILRRQNDASKTIRKRRNVSVKWKDDTDLVCVKVFDSDDFERNSMQHKPNPLEQLSAPAPSLLPIESDEDIEWYEPVTVDFNNIPWSPYVNENSTSRGGSFKIDSEERDIQVKRELMIGEITVDTDATTPKEPPNSGIGGMAVTSSNGLILNTKIMVPF